MNTVKKRELVHHSGTPQRKRTDTSHASPPALFPSALRASLLSLLLAPLYMLALSLAAYFTKDPGSLVFACGILCAYLTAFTGGALAVKRHRCAPLPCGLLTACIQGVCTLLLSLALWRVGTLSSIGITLLLHAGLFPASVMGAYLARPRKKATKKNTHTRKRR